MRVQGYDYSLLYIYSSREMKAKGF